MRYRRRSSPRSWGCFAMFYHTVRARRVFPTLVGVFLRAKFDTLESGGLPHARGGVSLPEELRTATVLSSPRSWGCFQNQNA